MDAEEIDCEAISKRATQVLRVTGMKNRMDATHDSAFSLAYMIILHLRFVNH